MNCPKCLGKLTPLIVDGIEIDRCYVCEGIWFDPNELEALLSGHASDLKKLGLDSGVFDGKEAEAHAQMFNEKKGLCPRCGERMEHEHQKGVTFDYCVKGDGIWLDGGEILGLKKNRKLESFDFFAFFKYTVTLEWLTEFKKLIAARHKSEDNKKRGNRAR